MVPVVNQNSNNHNLVYDSESNDEGDEHLFDEDVDEEIKSKSKSTIKSKVVHVMKKL